MYKIFFLIICSSFVHACLWDTDTINDEMQILKNETLFYLISGQFPHHSKAYYQSRISNFKKNTVDLDASNDLAVAYLRIGAYQKSLGIFKQLESTKPAEYKILSNLGVLYKKMGKFGKAIEYTKRALKIKPEGHLGLGNYYLLMLDWRKKVASKTPTYNFLGTPYEVEEEVNYQFHDATYSNFKFPDEKKLKALIRADKSFVDSYVVFGDVLRSQRHFNLSLWCYVKAKELGHPNIPTINKRIVAIFDHWRSAVNVTVEGAFLSVESQESTEKAIVAELKKSKQWLEKFQKVEKELLHSNKKVDFSLVEKELNKRGIKRSQPGKHGLKLGLTFANPMFWVFAVIALVIFIYIAQKIRGK